MKRKGFICVVVAFFFTGLVASASDLKLPVPDVETLPNGMELIWFVSDRLPSVDLAMTFKSGTRDDPSGKSGTSELLGATLDRGAGGVTAQEIARKAESLGASRYATPDSDFFRVGMHGLAPDATELLELLSKIVLQPDFPATEVQKEKERILEGWNQVADYGESLVDLAYQRALTQGTAYGRGDFLTSKEFSRVTRQDVLDYYHRNFTPKNAVLLIVGRVDRKVFRAKIEALFGDWKGESPKRDKKTYTSFALAPRHGEVMVIDRPSLTQTQVRIGFRAPLINDPRHYPLTVANALLGEYFHSRLNTLIRDKLGLTYGISSSFGYNRDLATFTISSATRNESVGQLIQKTLEVLKDLKKGPVPADEVQMAKEYLVGGFPLGTATLEGVASRWIQTYLFDLGPNRLNEYVSKVQATSPADVVSAVTQTFDLGHLTIAVAGDAKAIEKSLKDTHLPFKRISTKQLLE